MLVCKHENPILIPRTHNKEVDMSMQAWHWAGRDRQSHWACWPTCFTYLESSGLMCGSASKTQVDNDCGMTHRVDFRLPCGHTCMHPTPPGANMHTCTHTRNILGKFTTSHDYGVQLFLDTTEMSVCLCLSRCNSQSKASA